MGKVVDHVPDADGRYVDGRKWRVDYATPEDFKFFDWKWTEGGPEEFSKHRKGSQSRSRSRSPMHSGRSDSPANTKH